MPFVEKGLNARVLARAIKRAKNALVASTQICNFVKRLFYKKSYILIDSLASQMPSICLLKT